MAHVLKTRALLIIVAATLAFLCVGFLSSYEVTRDYHSITYGQVLSNTILAVVGAVCVLFALLTVYMTFQRDLKLGFSQSPATRMDRVGMVIMTLSAMGLASLAFWNMFH